MGMINVESQICPASGDKDVITTCLLNFSTSIPSCGQVEFNL